MQLKQIAKNVIFGFQRLRINDMSEAADQPLTRGKVSVICNGEIYNFAELKEKYGFKFESGTDCEVLLHLYEKFGNVADFIDQLDGVFAFVLNDDEKGLTFVGRDPIGVRPIFVGQDSHGSVMFASEAKVLVGLADPNTIVPFEPGSFWSSDTRRLTKYWDPKHNLEEVDL